MQGTRQKWPRHNFPKKEVKLLQLGEDDELQSHQAEQLKGLTT